MGKLKLGNVLDDKTVLLKIEITGTTHRDLIAYAEAVARETGNPIKDPAKLIAPMIVRFMSSDREFRKLRNKTNTKPGEA